MAAIEINYSENDFIAVPMKSLIHRKVAVADLYLRLPSDRMVKIAHKGGEIDIERIHRLGLRDVQYLYVHKDSLSAVTSELVDGAEQLNRTTKVIVDKKINHFFNVAEAVYAEMLKLPISPESLFKAIRMSQEFSHLMSEKPDFAKLLRVTVDIGDEFSRHSLGTVVIASLITEQLQWKSERLKSPILMGAFFHDIGLKEVPAELRFKNRIELSPDESSIWESHVGIGVQLLNRLPFISPDVLRIVAEHHEIPNGTGFPGRLRLDRMYTPAKVMSLANLLAHDIFDLSQGAFSLDHLKKKIDHIYGPMFGADLGRAAKNLFKGKGSKASGDPDPSEAA